jgi:class 3 adenylate cyclase
MTQTNKTNTYHIHIFSDNLAGLESGEGETRMIASALIKLSSMLQIAFGTAGASIIASNLDNSSQEQAIQPIVPGRRMMGIFGFCDVRNFTNATECLQEDIMVYINCIAEYAHTAVSDNGGFPNKNVGDAFLMAWPLTEGAWTSQTLGVKTSVQESAESALRALLRVILETSCSHILRRMSSNPELQKRIPGFRTELGFGLHIGWAIEGAIGSAEKVDPSYLSPDVEMSMKLEAATKHYGVSILLTNNFYDVLPHNIQQLCRCIDRVQEPGSRTPVDLYTYDFNSFSVQSGKMPTVLGKPEKSFWDQFPPSTSANFRATFATAMRHYTNGYWNSAKEFLDMCLLEEPKDLATQRLIEVLAHHDFEAPANWKGFREVSGNSFGPYDPDEKSFHTASFRKTSVAASLASLASESSLQSQDTPKRVTSRAEFGYSQL